ncbi:hypothetical protein PT974_06735 [Cladobotryum mycophilum]|uniref:Uncharacterized protein n=1 Tax=Cladobotryum mycophilum TaxID=491253 RepID=A0ABR0SNJ3_9HYPO
MGGRQHKKRQAADDLAQDERPGQRTKSSEDNNSPSFWDNLPEVPLTEKALAELNRRNNLKPRPSLVKPKRPAPDMARFARQGGPDLGHLRNYPPPPPRESEKPPAEGSGKGPRKGCGEGGGKSSAYDRVFESDIARYGIHMPASDFIYDGMKAPSKPANTEEIVGLFSRNKGRKSLSDLSKAVFERFKRNNAPGTSGGVIMRRVISVIEGDTEIPNSGQVKFSQLYSMTGKTTVTATPDYFDGAWQQQIHIRVKDDLGEFIIPTGYSVNPIAPNFFLEVKGRGGDWIVGVRQACYDGAHGARAMQVLQSYAESKVIYDGNAYAYSCVYMEGKLNLYAHHITASEAEGDLQGYHMTELKTILMTTDYEDFVKGVSAFRNLRNFAKKQRDALIEKANEAAKANLCGVGKAEK